jgi:hypothetical protein
VRKAGASRTCDSWRSRPGAFGASGRATVSPAYLGGLSESRGSRNARRAEDRRESRGASGTCSSFPSNSNHHLNKPRLQAVRPKAALFCSFPPTSAPSWRPDGVGVRGIGDVRLGKCYNVRASSERRADPTVLPPLGAPVLRVSADTSVGGRAREEMRIPGELHNPARDLFGPQRSGSMACLLSARRTNGAPIRG